MKVGLDWSLLASSQGKQRSVKVGGEIALKSTVELEKGDAYEIVIGSAGK